MLKRGGVREMCSAVVSPTARSAARSPVGAVSLRGVPPLSPCPGISMCCIRVTDAVVIGRACVVVLCAGCVCIRRPRCVVCLHVLASTLSYPIPSNTVPHIPPSSTFIHFSFGNVLPETVLPWGFNGFAPETGGVQGSSADNDAYTVVNENGGA